MMKHFLKIIPAALFLWFLYDLFFGGEGLIVYAFWPALLQAAPALMGAMGGGGGGDGKKGGGMMAMAQNAVNAPKQQTANVVATGVNLASHLINKKKMNAMMGDVMYNEQELGQQARVSNILRQLDTGVRSQPTIDRASQMNAALMMGTMRSGGGPIDLNRAYRAISANTQDIVQQQRAQQQGMYEGLFDSLAQRVVGREQNIRGTLWQDARAQKTAALKDAMSTGISLFAGVGGASGSNYGSVAESMMKMQNKTPGSEGTNPVPAAGAAAFQQAPAGAGATAFANLPGSRMPQDNTLLSANPEISGLSGSSFFK